MLTNEEPVNVEPIGQPVSSSNKVVVKATKPPKPLNAREKNFCLLIDKGMKGNEAVRSVGYNSRDDKSASAYASKLMAKDSIRAELGRLYKLHESHLVNDFVTPFKDRFVKAIETLDDLQDNGNDYVRLSATKEILDRVAPKITRNESIKVTITDKEKARRMKVLGITDATSVETVQPAQLEKPL